MLNKKHKAKEEELECKKPIKKSNNKKFITEAEVNSQRKIQIDNYSIKLFKAINDWVITKIQNQIPNSLSEKKKIKAKMTKIFFSFYHLNILINLFQL